MQMDYDMVMAFTKLAFFAGLAGAMTLHLIWILAAGSIVVVSRKIAQLNRIQLARMRAEKVHQLFDQV